VRDRAPRTLLLAEDDNSLRNLAREVLEGDGYRVLAAERGEEALRLAASHEGPIDLLITDLIMPGIGGAELARRLEALRPGLATFFISGDADGEIARSGVPGPRALFLQKPFSILEFVDAVSRALSAFAPAAA